MFGHIDVDAFFASVLVRRHPQLRGKPILALGMGGGCVIAASYEAKACGIRTGMRLHEAKKLCTEAIAFPSDFEEALAASRAIIGILQEHAPYVEPMSVDEWFVDLRTLVGGIPRDPSAWAQDLQHEIQRRVALTVSIGIAPTKLLAKMASEYRKPAGATVVHERFPQAISIESFLRDRVAEAIPGIGRRRSIHCAHQGWRTAYDVAFADAETIRLLFGKPGIELRAELQGTAMHRISRTTVAPKSVSRCRSFRSTAKRETVYSHALHHLMYTVMKMRRENRAAKDMLLWMRDDAYRYADAHVAFPQALDTEEQMLPYLRHCFGKLWKPNTRATQVGMALQGLVPNKTVQYSLFEEAQRIHGAEAQQRALDVLHRKYGRSSVFRGSALPTQHAQKPHLSVW